MAEFTGDSPALFEHLTGKVTTICRCWLIERRDGWVRGFTDHDQDLVFDGVTFSASTGMTASSLEATTGSSVNNAEAIGALNDIGLSEEDIEAGRFDAAEVRFWLVNWMDPEQRVVRFRGTIGENTRNDESFSAELRGMTDPLNQPRGQVFQSSCSAVLGDDQCRVDLDQAEFSAEVVLEEVEDARVLRFSNPAGFDEYWFERGRLEVVDGAGQGLRGWIKNDLVQGDIREVTLWKSLRSDIRPGDTVRLRAGCDKCASTCASKFANFYNFRGFPHIPGEDWLTSYPVRGSGNDGGSMNSPIVS